MRNRGSYMIKQAAKGLYLYLYLIHQSNSIYL
jgi:hypothetical protein